MKNEKVAIFLLTSLSDVEKERLKRCFTSDLLKSAGSFRLTLSWVCRVYNEIDLTRMHITRKATTKYKGNTLKVIHIAILLNYFYRDIDNLKKEPEFSITEYHYNIANTLGKERSRKENILKN
jgi:hypothetical protein